MWPFEALGSCDGAWVTRILAVLDRELRIVTDQLHDLLQGVENLPELLSLYLNYLETEENFFSAMCRDLPFLDESIRRQIFFRESATRSYFHDALVRERRKGTIKDIDITQTLNFLFGTINYFLANRESFAGNQSVIALKKQVVQKTFLALIK